jgi:arabinose-5-phosphate isomerase
VIKITVKWSDSVERQAKALLSAFNDENLRKDMDDLIFNYLKNFKDIIYFTGIGKNMHVAARVSDTFNSLGIRSIFVDPIETLHGNMGIFTGKEILIAISKSGETEELINFIKTYKSLGYGDIILFTSNSNSTLAKMVKKVITVKILKEGDHLNLAPISSTMIFGVLLDAIAVQLSSERNFTKNDFIKNHPGGSLGRTRVAIN